MGYVLKVKTIYDYGVYSWFAHENPVVFLLSQYSY